MNDKYLLEKYGPMCSSDNAYTARARFMQSWYRAIILMQNDFGFGPEESSKTKYGNVLVNGEKTGLNFLSPKIFHYAQFRTQFLKNGETIKEYRLFNNMLSSQPMCFNLFYPLKELFEKDHKKACKLFKDCFPALQIDQVLAVEIEYLPYPVSEYLNDRTAFDAMLIYKTASGERNILAIETKYVEKLGNNPSSNLSKQIELVNNCKMFNDHGKKEVSNGFGQLGRNFLLAEKFRMENRLDKVFAVVISPEENTSSKNEIKEFYSTMNEEFHSRLFYVSLEDMIKRIKSNPFQSIKSWVDLFEKRYLRFEESDKLLLDIKR